MQTDPVYTFEAFSVAEQKLVGLCQEMRLRADDSGGEDQMWFRESVEAVVKDAAEVMRLVARDQRVSIADVRRFCGFKPVADLVD